MDEIKDDMKINQIKNFELFGIFNYVRTCYSIALRRNT